MNHALLATAGAILLSITAQPAAAADPTTIDCVPNGLDAATRQALLAGVRKQVQEQPSGFHFDDAIKLKLVAASEKCVALFGWTQKARTVALEYSLIKDSISAYEAIVQGDGLDVIKIEAVVRALPPAQFAKLSPDLISQGDAEALAGVLARANINIETRKQGNDVGALISLMSVAEKMKAEFAAS
jgi:hypothetical protein